MAAITDFLDGYVARARGEESVLGAALDPLADKVLTVCATIILIDIGQLGGFTGIGALIIVLREVWIAGLREAVVGQGGSLPVTKLAKWKTTFQFIAYAGLIAIVPGGFFSLFSVTGLQTIVMGLFWTSVVLTFWTGADYTVRAISFLRRQ